MTEKKKAAPKKAAAKAEKPPAPAPEETTEPSSETPGADVGQGELQEKADARRDRGYEGFAPGADTAATAGKD